MMWTSIVEPAIPLLLILLRASLRDLLERIHADSNKTPGPTRGTGAMLLLRSRSPRVAHL